MPRNRTQRRAAAEAASRVKEDDNDGDSEWEAPEESSAEEELEPDSEEPSEEYPTEEEEETPPKKKPVTKSKKQNAAVYDDNDDDDDEDDLLPSYARKTAKGGYAHTNKSRARISKANKGNTPWNKGKNRSQAVRAKIAAGVRARNRAVLLEKLKKLGLTEKEWLAKKKEIKYLRERVRKAKKNAEKRETKKKGKSPTYEELQSELAAKLAEQMQAMQPNDEVAVSLEEQKVASTKTKKELLQKVFSSHVEWTRHDYDTTHNRLYEQLCPTGGPGGLVCCEVCATAYSRYLNQTSTDLDVQSVHQVGKEVQELVGFMQETRSKLQKKVVLARHQAPPLKRDSGALKSAPVKLSGLGQTASV